MHVPTVGGQFGIPLAADAAYQKNTSLTVPVWSLRDTMNKLNHTYVDIVKIDVEGSEYMVIDELATWPDSQVRFGQLIFEFHFIHTYENSTSTPMTNTAEKLYSMGFRPIFNSGVFNNIYIEATYMRTET